MLAVIVKSKYKALKRHGLERVNQHPVMSTSVNASVIGVRPICTYQISASYSTMVIFKCLLCSHYQLITKRHLAFCNDQNYMIKITGYTYMHLDIAPK